MRDKYGVIDLGLDESQDYLISPEFPNAKEAIRRLKSTFNEHHRLAQGAMASSRRTPLRKDNLSGCL